MQCDYDDYNVVYDKGVFTLILLSSFLVLVIWCYCYGCCNRKPGEGNKILNVIMWSLCVVIGVVYVIFLVVSSIYVFSNFSENFSSDEPEFHIDCNGLRLVPFANLIFMYFGLLCSGSAARCACVLTFNRCNE